MLLKKRILFLTITIALIACQSKTEEKEHTLNSTTGTEGKKEAVVKKTEPTVKSIYYSNVLAIENVSINNHKLILPKSEFDSLYGTTIDSTRADIWECANPFVWLDEEWMIKTYGKDKEMEDFARFNGKIATLFSKGRVFHTNNHIVLFERTPAKNNQFRILSHQIVLDQNTTVATFRKKFPDVAPEKTNDSDEPIFRIYTDNDRVDAFLFYFKNGKLDYMTLWFELC